MARIEQYEKVLIIEVSDFNASYRRKEPRKREEEINKPAARTAGADPSRCNSTNRQNPPIQP